MKCFLHLSLLCSQAPTPSYFGSIVYYIARDFIDHISHCTSLALKCLVLLSHLVLVGRFITAKGHTEKQYRDTHGLCKTDFPERQFQSLMDDLLVVWSSFSHNSLFIVVLSVQHHLCYKAVPAE